MGWKEFATLPFTPTSNDDQFIVHTTLNKEKHMLFAFHSGKYYSIKINLDNLEGETTWEELTLKEGEVAENYDGKGVRLRAVEHFIFITFEYSFHAFNCETLSYVCKDETASPCRMTKHGFVHLEGDENSREELRFLIWDERCTMFIDWNKEEKGALPVYSYPQLRVARPGKGSNFAYCGASLSLSLSLPREKNARVDRTNRVFLFLLISFVFAPCSGKGPCL